MKEANQQRYVMKRIPPANSATLLCALTSSGRAKAPKKPVKHNAINS